MSRPKRILIAGTSGAGKSKLARQISGSLGLPYVEIDSLYHGPDWTPRADFETDVDAFTSQDSWVTEWQYGRVRSLLAQRAELLVWLDYPVPLVMWRVTKRTLRRWIGNEELWNGNREPGLFHALTDREGIIRWAWDTRHKTAGLVLELATSQPHLQVVRLSSPAETREWVASLLPPDTGPVP